METKKNPQLLVPLILLSVLFSPSLALTALEAEALRIPFEGRKLTWSTFREADLLQTALAENDSFRNLRHADGVFTSNISSPLVHRSPKSYPEPLIEKRASNDISEDHGPIKRHSNTELTFAYSRLIKVKTGSKGLKKLLRGKSPLTLQDPLGEGKAGFGQIPAGQAKKPHLPEGPLEPRGHLKCNMPEKDHERLPPEHVQPTSPAPSSRPPHRTACKSSCPACWKNQNKKKES